MRSILLVVALLAAVPTLTAVAQESGGLAYEVPMPAADPSVYTVAATEFASSGTAVSQSASPCPCGHCATCECPSSPAPCLECPHVSTLTPFWNMHLFGALQANMMFSTARAVAPGTPFFLAPETPLGEQNTVDIHARSSYLGAVLQGPEVGQFRASGLFLAYLYNDAVIVDRYGVLPVQAWGELKNNDWRFSAGLQFNVFCPNMPTMLVWSSMLGSGNVGNNFPGQFRVERYLHPNDHSQWTMQIALSDPVPTSIANNFNVTEDNGWPTLEGRLSYATGELKQEGLEAKRAFELGVSTIGGQLRTFVPLQGDVIANTFGAGVDFRWRVTERWGVVGELFAGQGLGVANGGVLQNTNTATLDSIRTCGGWGEVYYYLTPCLHTHVGAAVDDPLDRDLAVGQIEKNQTVFANLLWDVTQQFRVGIEGTYRETDYLGLPDNDGYGLHTQVQWSF